jgi:hypothetical protein
MPRVAAIALCTLLLKISSVQQSIRLFDANKWDKTISSNNKKRHQMSWSTTINQYISAITNHFAPIEHCILLLFR